jgi:signal transduction histidine kinase
VAAAALAVLSLIVAALAVRTAGDVPELGYADGTLGGAALLVVPGALAIAAGFVARRRPDDRAGLLLIVAGLGSFLPELATSGARPAAAFTAGLALAWLTPAVVAHLALGYPGRVAGRVRLLAGAGYVTAVGLLGLVPALAFEPREAGCALCADNLIGVGYDAEWQLRLARIGILATLAWAIIAGGVLLVRLARASRALRSLTAPVLVPGVVLLACFAAELALSPGRGYLGTDGVDGRLWIAQQLALAAVAGGVAARSVRAARARARLAADVVALADPARPAGVAARLGAVLGDPSLVVAYPVGDPVRWVDAAGQPVPLPPGGGRQATELRVADDAEAIALAVHRGGLLDDPVLRYEVVRAAGLALGNERLRADARARLADLRASRARIVATGDAERRRIERDLHDGAQQRIVALAIALRAAAPADEDPAAPLVTEALREVGGALDELRLIAHGIFPAILAEAGLAIAIDALAESAPVAIRLGPFPDGRFDHAVEAAAYALVAECARHPDAAALDVHGAVDGDELVVVVETTGRLPPETRIADRVGALGGVVRHRRLDDRAVLEAVVPCGS